jgi:Cdc6-like AAA superfamily ATPase
MKGKIVEITNNTMVPLSFIVAGWFAVSWVLDIKKTAEINAMTVNESKQTAERLTEKIDSMHERLARMEESLNYLKEHVRRRKNERP